MTLRGISYTHFLSTSHFMTLQVMEVPTLRVDEAISNMPEVQAKMDELTVLFNGISCGRVQYKPDKTEFREACVQLVKNKDKTCHTRNKLCPDVSFASLGSERCPYNNDTFSFEFEYEMASGDNCVMLTGTSSPSSKTPACVGSPGLSMLPSYGANTLAPFKIWDDPGDLIYSIYKVASELLVIIDPGYADGNDYVINFNTMFAHNDRAEHWMTTDGGERALVNKHYVKKHDAKDGFLRFGKNNELRRCHHVAFQYTVVLGSEIITPACARSGGELKLWGSDGSTQVIDAYRKVVKMDARLPHEVCAFKGMRYSITYYKLSDRRMTGAMDIYEPAMVL